MAIKDRLDRYKGLLANKARCSSDLWNDENQNKLRGILDEQQKFIIRHISILEALRSRQLNRYRKTRNKENLNSERLCRDILKYVGTSGRSVFLKPRTLYALVSEQLHAVLKKNFKNYLRYFNEELKVCTKLGHMIDARAREGYLAYLRRSAEGILVGVALLLTAYPALESAYYQSLSGINRHLERRYSDFLARAEADHYSEAEEKLEEQLEDLLRIAVHGTVDTHTYQFLRTLFTIYFTDANTLKDLGFTDLYCNLRKGGFWGSIRMGSGPVHGMVFSESIFSKSKSEKDIAIYVDTNSRDMLRFALHEIAHGKHFTLKDKNDFDRQWQALPKGGLFPRASEHQASGKDEDIAETVAHVGGILYECLVSGRHISIIDACNSTNPIDGSVDIVILKARLLHQYGFFPKHFALQ